MSILDRLKRYMDHKGVNINQVRIRAGLKPGTLNKAFKEGKELRSGTVEAILRHFDDLSAEWLLLDIGPMIRANPRVENTPSIAAEPPAVYEKLNNSQRSLRAVQRATVLPATRARQMQAVREKLEEPGVREAIRAELLSLLLRRPLTDEELESLFRNS